MLTKDPSVASATPSSSTLPSPGENQGPDWLAWIGDRLQVRPDAEHEMTLSRLAYAALIAIVFAVMTWTGTGGATARSALLGAVGLTVYLAAAAGLFAHLLWQPGISVPRRIAGLVLDIVMISGFAATFGVAGGFLYPLFVWVALDNGFRFGRRYLQLATLLGSAGLCAALAATASWIDQPALAVVLQAGMIMLPLCVGLLMERSVRLDQQVEAPAVVEAVAPQLNDMAVADDAAAPLHDDVAARPHDDEPDVEPNDDLLAGAWSAVALPADESVKVPLGGLSILVAEDNSTSQLILCKVLEHAGHRVTVVGNGDAAVAKLRAQKFDVALMDTNMPVMNGIEATKLYRLASIGRPRIPIIALLTDTTPAAWKTCEEAGMDAWTPKPIEPIRLLDIIDSVAIRHPLAEPARLLQQTVADEVEDEAFAPSEAASGERGETAVVDMDTLDNLEQLGGVEFVQDLVAQFSRDSAQLLNGLCTAVEQGDAHRFREVAHALRSSAANVGATKVFEMCLALRAVSSKELAVDGEVQASLIGKEIANALSALEARAAGGPVVAVTAPVEPSIAAHG